MPRAARRKQTPCQGGMGVTPVTIEGGGAGIVRKFFPDFFQYFRPDTDPTGPLQPVVSLDSAYRMWYGGYC